MLRLNVFVHPYPARAAESSFGSEGGRRGSTQVSESTPISWSTISGLTDRERQLGRFMFGDVDLRGVALVDVTVNGERLPDIVHGEVLRSERRAS